MVHKLRFDVRDVPACARYGLSARKMWIFFKAMLFAWASWIIFVYLGYLAAGESLAARWSSGRLLPLPAGVFWESWASVVLLIVGLLLAVVAILLAQLKTCKVTFEQIRGDDFFSGKDAARFCRSHYKPVLATPLILLVGLAIAFGGALLFGLIISIPSVGPIVGGLSVVFGWGKSLLVVLGGVAFLLSFIMVPAIVATTKGDIFESLFELFSTITSQSWRLFVYCLVAFVCRTLGLIVFALFSVGALAFMFGSVSLVAGEAFGASVSTGLQTLAPEAVGAFSSLVYPVGPGAGGQPWGGVSGALCALSAAAIFLVLLSYWLSSGCSGGTLIYLALRHKKDGEDLLQRADDEEYREFEEQFGSDEGEGPGEPAERQRRIAEDDETEQDEED